VAEALRDLNQMEIRGDSSWLSTLVAPISTDEFLSRYWRKQHLLCRGAAGRFSGLLSWTTVNEMLAHHWREPSRFRLARQGRDLEPASYAELGGSTPYIRARDVTEHLRRGATLSFDAVDELHEPLAHLAQSFESFFRGGTQINLYAAWRSLYGLDLHRDDEEVFIVQLDGRKRWLLYGFSVDDIDRTELRSTSVPPGAMLDQTLQPGDLLYIPRGCYHVAVPMNEPALHLTVGVKLPRAIDLARWMLDRLRTNGMADRDLPSLADAAERLRYSDDVREMLTDGLEPDLVQQYLRETYSTLKQRPSFNLPWTAATDPMPPGRDFLVRLNVHGPLAVHDDRDAMSLEFEGGGRRYRFPRSMQWIIEPLNDGAPLPMTRLIDAVAGRLDEDMVRVLIAMLVKDDLVSVSAPSRSSE
jgi:ribosomal protein L16 Arg81 hydroxylase